jgi:hypothetical protein
MMRRPQGGPCRINDEPSFLSFQSADLFFSSDGSRFADSLLFGHVLTTLSRGKPTWIRTVALPVLGPRRINVYLMSNTPQSTH